MIFSDPYPDPDSTFQVGFGRILNINFTFVFPSSK
jgi:hypothetical protein